MTSMAMAQSPGEVSDEYLAERARHGDEQAFAVLAARYRDVAFAYAYARLRQRDEAEDVVQEAFVRAFVALPRIRASRCWAAWLMQIVRNLCHDATRRRGRCVESIQEEWPDDSPPLYTRLLVEERGRELNKAVSDLPEKYRTPLLMHYASGRSYREIALALDIPETTVVGRLAAGLRRLRRRFSVAS